MKRLAALLLPLLAALAAAPVPEPPHVVLVLDDGTSREVAWADAVGEHPLEPARAAWAWTADSPPVRLPPADLPAYAPPSAARRLRVQSALPPGTREPPPLELVAAPVEMWKEVPESLLPRWPVIGANPVSVPVDLREWRVRLVGPGHGSGWLDVPAGLAATVVAPAPAEPIVLTVRGGDDRPLSNARLSVAAPHPERGGGEKLADYRSGEDGTAVLPALPPDLDLVVIVVADDHVPRVVEGRSAALPRAIELEPGLALSGRLVDEEGRPIAGAEVSVRFWISERLPATISRRGASDEAGRWSVSALPAARVELIVEAPGRATFHRVLELPADAAQVVSVRLEPAVRLELRVRDERSRPVGGAEVETAATDTVATDPAGVARLAVAPDEPLALRVTAPGHLPTEKSLPPPLPRSFDVRLERAFRVVGRLVDVAGTPLSSGTVRSRTGRSFADTELDAGGRFQLDLPAGAPVSLTLRSQSTRDRIVDVAPGVPGEVRDLGDVAAPPGWAVRGRLLRADDATPVAGARVWAPRPGDAGPLMAWFLGDLLETRSDGEGNFVLTGLPPLAVTLRVETAGMAVRRLPVVAEDPEVPLELGDVFLDTGATVAVVAEGAPDDAQARLDVGLRNLPMDLLVAPLSGGEGALDHVPPGPARLSVVSGDTVLCEEEVTVPPAGELVEVECSSRPLRVSGRVEVAGIPSGPGSLLWAPDEPNGETIPEAVMTFRSGAIEQLHTFSVERSPTRVPVDERGEFATEALRRGSWKVRWMPDEGPWPEPRRLTIGEGEQQEIVLRWDGVVVRGVVLDPSDRPIDGAHVLDHVTGSFALTSADGTFALAVPAQGTHVLQARHGTRRSVPLEVSVAAGEEPDAVTLVVGDGGAEEGGIVVQVRTEEGDPAAGALVLLEIEGGGLRVLTADSSGVARVGLLPLPPPRWRAAAVHENRWAFGGWRMASGEPAELVADGSGSLRVVSREGVGELGLVRDDGWDVGDLLRWLGAVPNVAPQRPLFVGGLPAGTYRVTLDDAARVAGVAEGEVTDVELP